MVNYLLQEATMTTRANGTFEVKMTSLDPYNQTENALLGRMSLDKEFRGDLEAPGKGEMLTAGTNTENSAGYVAMERITGTLHGRSGSFVFQHSGTMNRGTPHLILTIVPDSGTGELTGIAGSMAIKFAGEQHLYEFDYSLENN
jgi:hypothetical protein